MTKNLNEANNFDDFSWKAEEEQSKVVEGYAFPFQIDELKNDIFNKKVECFSKFAMKQTLLIMNKILEVLANYDSTTMKHSAGISQQSLNTVLEEVLNKAEKELLALTKLSKDSDLWKFTKKQFSSSIARLQQHYFRKNLEEHIGKELQKVLTDYDCIMKEESIGISQQRLNAIHKEAVKKAENELLALPNLAKNSDLLESIKKQFSYSIARLQQHHIQKNSLLFIGNHEGEAVKTSYCEPSSIKIDKTKCGILGRGGFSTVRVGFLEHYGTVAVKFNRYSGSDVEITNAEQKCRKEIALLHHANHENILRFLGYTFGKESMAIITEYMPGARMAVRYGTFGICVLRTSHLEPYRTSVPYFSSIFEAYRTRTIPKKAYRTSVPYL